MSDSTVAAVPDGFEQLPMGYGFTDTLSPLYRKVADKDLRLGMIVGPQHSNTMGICHGGALMTLADIAGASWGNMARGKVAGAPTINLSIDFISSAKRGEWVEARQEGVELKRLFGFVRGVICNQKGVVARFNASFYFPDHPGLSQDGLVKPVTTHGLINDDGG
ncbi:PaaI family thioesterase [Pseudohalioglobus lutimaris]|uniref:PaaI family thioesterase n=1 Tax=Pseudohalioglobus lutimaris TaxID=1737061 RepID=A0A2N5X4K6_9GAMM|nr:PaaI family thioesterase [Pseudohalioglobus lutimaris]PLW69416.1 PaaI family thioesterase [Pseudohalioglobus lutimaris]